MDACRDDRVILHAPTGSGKTVAFALPFLRRVGGRKPSGLIVAPSRELALQISDVIRSLSTGFKVAVLYGGHSMADERASLSVMPDVVIATPGRLVDHLKRGTLPGVLPSVRALVIDEYDKALTLGFREEMRRIVRALPNLKSIILTSATKGAALTADIFGKMSFKALDFSDEPGDGVPSAQVPVFIITSPGRDKLDTAVGLVRHISGERIIIFVNHRESAERVHAALCEASVCAGLYHGGLGQTEREKAVILFNNGTSPVLVATDLGARGLDIDSVSTVVHYHLPLSAEAYVHRNGRTARQGAPGRVVVIKSEGEALADFIEGIPTEVESLETPSEILPPTVTIYINAGRREKVSRGDIVGFLCKTVGIQASDIGTIDVRDHSAYVAVARVAASAVPSGNVRLKSVSVRLSPVK